MVTKEVLSQYVSIKKEINEVQERIAKTEQQLDKLYEEGTVYDKVMGGEGGNKPYKIEGIPFPAISKKKTLLMARKATLMNLELDLINTTNEVEEFLSRIDDSYARRIIDYRFLQNMTWNEVADNIGGNNTEDSVRKYFERFFDKIS